MKSLKGVPASKGIAIGRLLFHTANPYKVEKFSIEDIDAELVRFEKARHRAIDKLNNIYEKALQEIGQEDSMIFQIHAMMMEDLDYIEGVTTIITEQRVNAEYAVDENGKRFANIFAEMQDEYMRQRGADVLDISKSLVRELACIKEHNLDDMQGQFIIAADDLMPSETVQLDKSKVIAFVTRAGSKISHSAILARTMGIPAVVGLGDEYDELEDEDVVVVDGFNGEVFIAPNQQTLEKYEALRKEYVLEREKLGELKGKASETLDGVKIEINANIGHSDDVQMVLDNDAEGIGLFRSEFLYMEGNDFPTEEAQYQVYQGILKRMNGKRVIVRTLDLGADKHAPYFDIPNEDNPAMGYRAVRICLSRPEIFTAQLRALLRASVHGHLAIMVPMIISLEEVLETKKLIEKIKEDLRAQDIPFSDNYEFGIMIETPAAVMISDILAKHVDFFSIGTNDLTQYTLAVDRMNQRIGNLYNPRHTAVLRMMRIAVENGKKHGIWTGICGESAADLELTSTFLAMGVAELSVTPTAVLDVRRKVREINLGECAPGILEQLEHGTTD